jgi:esterase
MTVKLHYQIVGEGEPLLVLHGLFGSHRNWFSITRQLAVNRQVIALDLRNHGASGHADSMSYPEMAEDLHQLVSALGHEQIDLMGHSMGGKTAMAFALLYPEQVGKLIVVDIAPVNYQLNHDEIIAALRTVPVASLGNRAEADSLLATHIPEPGLRQYLLQNLIKDDTGFRWRLNLDAIHFNHPLLRSFPEKLAGSRWEGSSLFLSGSESDFVLPEYTADIQRYFPSAQQHIIEGANHWVHADKPAEVVSVVSAFLNK